MSPVRRLWPALARLIAIGPAASAQATEAVDAVARLTSREMER